ncbi:MAG: hypothetical protein AAGL49_12695, partial [Pseudomonadota bacterium]
MNSKVKLGRAIRALAVGTVAGALATASAQAQLREAIGTSQQTASDTAASQERIDQIDDQTEALVREYRATLKQLDQRALLFVIALQPVK